MNLQKTMVKMAKKIYALLPSEREKTCNNHLVTYAGLIPCTGNRVCLMCGAEVDREEQSHE